MELQAATRGQWALIGGSRELRRPPVPFMYLSRCRKRSPRWVRRPPAHSCRQHVHTGGNAPQVCVDSAPSGPAPCLCLGWSLNSVLWKREKGSRKRHQSADGWGERNSSDGEGNQKFSLPVVAGDDWQNPGWTGESWNRLQVEKVHATAWTVCLSRQGQELAASKNPERECKRSRKQARKEE